MISPMYLALFSACKTHSLLPQCTRLAVKGDFSAARALANQAKQGCTDVLSISCMNQAAADMSILLGEYEQAEAWYACSVSVLSGSEFLNAMSCRATGIQALFQNRFEVAAHCFRRNAEETVPMEYRLESYATLALIYREVGLDKVAQENYQELRSLAKRTSSHDWFDLSSLLALDLAAYRTVYASSAMGDHIFRNMSGAANEIVDELLACDDSDDFALSHELAPLLRDRNKHLKNMIHLAAGKTMDWDDLKNFAYSTFAKNSRLYLKYACLEIGLAAIAGGHHDIVQKLVLSYPWLDAHDGQKLKSMVRIDQTELLYFRVKLKTKCVSIEGKNSLYQLYLESVFRAIHQLTNKLQLIVANGLINASAITIQIKESESLGQISESIPLRCQRAYDYIKENSWRSDVSVREVASIIGVSERWLQLQFKRHYGCSPKTLIRNRYQVELS